MSEGGVHLGPVAHAVEPEVLGHRESVEDPPPLGHVNDAPADALGRRDAGEVDTVEPHGAAHRLDQPRDRSERRRLAGAVCPDQRHDLAGSHRPASGRGPRPPGHTRRSAARVGGWRCSRDPPRKWRSSRFSSHRRSRSRDPPHRCRSSRGRPARDFTAPAAQGSPSSSGHAPAAASARPRRPRRRHPAATAASRRNSRGEHPYAWRNSRLKWGALGSPQRLAIAEIGWSANAGSSRSRRQRSSRAERMKSHTRRPSASNTRCR